MSQHKHHGADRVIEGELPRAHAAMNITPMIDVLLNSQLPPSNAQPLPIPKAQREARRILGSWQLGVVGSWDLGVGR